MQTYYIVYRTTCLVTGEFYVGVHKTRDLHDGYLGSGTRIKRAIAQYGSSCFVREIIALCTNETEMYARERAEIAPHYGKPYFLNLHRGGRGGWEGVEEACCQRQKVWIVCPRSGRTKRIARREFITYVRDGWLWGRKLQRNGQADRGRTCEPPRPERGALPTELLPG